MYYNLLKLFRFNCEKSHIWIHQIIFGYMFYLSDVNIEDLCSKNLPLFYATGACVKICYDNSTISIENLNRNIDYHLDVPVFAPLEFFYPYYQDYNINNLKIYIKDFDKFLNQYNKLNSEIKLLSTNLL